MILNASGRIAIKCSQCGKYKIYDINLFEVKDKKTYKCSCGKEILKLRISGGELIAEIPCIACEIQHSYRYNLKDLMNKPIDIASCPVTGIEIAFLGRKKSVDNFVIRHIKDMNELLKFLGIEEERTRKIVK